ncbi:PREDICTED: uncharacterized protein LOC109239122 [Nicotiana attenuata]|uniref:Maternal effect embryo arrest 22 n=1 Tax=Nicotiana attenuata TaxID=49451 RepID=A0A314LAG4_NICAT|nr:PREDICTED: uncharacterized protein LOC109239122 [Nicotiana attenuata]OIT38670.1 hypothetical protein A4A49_30332 [Nicotiana attenuata]
MYESTSMADDVMIKEELTNPCCISWKEKYNKLKDGYAKLEDRRNALRKGLSIYEEQVLKMQSENLSLRKAVEDEKLRAYNEKEEKVKESALRVSLESEIAGLKNEILSLKQQSVANDGGREIKELKEHLSERESKVNELKVLVDKERVRAESEKKKAELERKKVDELRTKVKVEKTKADEERRLADVERKRAEGNRLNLESLKKEADQVKSKLASVTLEFEDAKKQLEAERENTSKERKRADAAVAKAADQKKIAETNRKMAMDEKSRATDLYRQLEHDRQKIDNLKKEIGELMASGKTVNIIPRKGTTLGTAQFSPEIGPKAVERDFTMADVIGNFDADPKRLQEMEQKVAIEKKRVKSEMEKVEKQRKAAEAYKKKASEEKNRADQLSEEVKNYRKRVEELQKEIEKLSSARTSVECPLRALDSSVHVETAKVKLLQKQLKLEKMLVKHAKKVAKFEKTRNYILQQNLVSLKQELVHFSRRLNILDGCFLQGDEHALKKVCSFNLKSNYSSLVSCDTHCHFGNDSVQLAAVGSDLSKQKIECNIPSLPMSGGNNPVSLSGINSKLEPLLKGSSKKVLQSSAMNSSSASFSDRLLVGSQDRCASITTSAKSAEEKLDVELIKSSLPGDARKKCIENVVAIADSNVKSPISCISTERRGPHYKRMRRSVDAIKSNGNLNSGGNKWQRQLSEKTSLHDGKLNSRTDGPAVEKKHLVADMQHDTCSEHFISRKKRRTSCELGLHPSNKNSVAKTKFDSCGVQSDVCTRLSPTVYSVPETAQDWKDGKDDDLGDIDELVRGDYMKLLNLDSDTDEESYRLAIEMPLSPTLPEIQCHSSEALESISSPLYQGFSNATGTLVSPDSFDVINVEINSNQLKHCTLDPSDNSSFSKKRDHVDSSKRINLDTSCKLSCSSYANASALCRSDLAAPASELERRVVSLWDGFAKYCVIFSNNNDENSISSIYRATSSSHAQCSASSDPSLRSILVTLLELEDISNKEKTCVFFSLLLLYIFDTATRAFGDDWERDLTLFVNSVAQHIYTELSHEDTRRMFVEYCNFYDVLSLMEDFLLHDKLLVPAVSSDSKLATNSGINLILDGHSVSLCKQLAPTQLLLIGGILLASVCSAVGHVGFVCEASCNILRMRRSDALNILHIFAYLCGSKYFILKEYGLAMTVVKSLVMLIHENRSSPDPLSCIGSSVESLSKICSGSKCPFSEGAATMDIVASSLLDSITSYTCSAVGSDLMESLNKSRRRVKCDGRKTGESSDDVDLVQSAFVISENSCQLTNTLALLELVAGFMSWDWMFDKIACPLLDLLDYCTAEHNAAAITTLLGQLGRSGLDAFGCEDVRIQRLRSSLCALLCQCDSKRRGLHLQFSIGIALIGLIPLSFEELAESNIEVASPANQCDPTDCLRKWFASLSSEQRLFIRLVDAAGLTSC